MSDLKCYQSNYYSIIPIISIFQRPLFADPDLGAVHKVQCCPQNEIHLKGGEGVGANVILFVTSGQH